MFAMKKAELSLASRIRPSYIDHDYGEHMKIAFRVLSLSFILTACGSELDFDDGSNEQALLSNVCEYSYRRAPNAWTATPSMAREFRVSMPKATTDTFFNGWGAEGTYKSGNGGCSTATPCYGKHARTFRNDSDRTLRVHYNTSGGLKTRRLDIGESSTVEGDILSVDCPQSTCNACLTVCSVAGEGDENAVASCQIQCYMQSCIP